MIAVTVPTALSDPFPGIAQAAAADPADNPLLAVRLGQPEHVGPLPVPGSECGSRRSPIPPRRPPRSRTPPRGRPGWPGRRGAPTR